MPGGVVLHVGPQLHHAVQVGVHPAPANLVAAGLGEPRMPEAGKERAHDHHRAAELGAFVNEFLRLDVGGIYGIGLEGIRSLGVPVYLYAHTLQQPDEVLHIQDFRDVGDGDGFAGEKHRAYDLQGFVFCALRGYGTGELMPSFDDIFRHALLLDEGLFRTFPGRHRLPAFPGR